VWFASSVPETTVANNLGGVDIGAVTTGAQATTNAAQFVNMRHVPFGSPYILHPNDFVLAVTLEWLRLPADLSGSVVGRSSLGRHGLDIATATHIHPHFFGCLTLELSNRGKVPIALAPGMTICQLLLHDLSLDAPMRVQAKHSGWRRPVIQPVQLDQVAMALGKLNEAISQSAGVGP
jgi:deoxycytidine triphosphate deaminase